MPHIPRPRDVPDRDERVVAGIDRLAAGSRDLGARDALLRIRHALHLGVTTRELLAVLDRLTGPGGTTGATLEALDDLADQAGRR
jgi:hypothetical protein